MASDAGTESELAFWKRTAKEKDAEIERLRVFERAVLIGTDENPDLAARERYVAAKEAFYGDKPMLPVDTALAWMKGYRCRDLEIDQLKQRVADLEGVLRNFERSTLWTDDNRNHG